MWTAILWTCALAGLQCGSVSRLIAPDIAVVQAAYEREAAAGSKLHDAGVQFLEAKCHGDAGSKFLCEVTFVSSGDADERLYFDIVALSPAEHGWRMTSGLCKR